MPRASSYRAAEREFFASISRPAPLDGLPAARAVQHAVDASRGQRVPVADTREVPLEELTDFERSKFFGDFDRAFADTEFMGDAP